MSFGGTIEDVLRYDSYNCLPHNGFRLTQTCWSTNKKGTIYTQTCASAPLFISIPLTNCEKYEESCCVSSGL